jgi:hypothetical protein
MRPIHQSPQAIALLVAAETVADEFRRGHNEDTQSRSFYAFKIFDPRVVECAWISHCRRLARDFDRYGRIAQPSSASP